MEKKTFYIPVGNMSLEEAREKIGEFRKDSDGVIRLKSEPKPEDNEHTRTN